MTDNDLQWHELCFFNEVIAAGIGDSRVVPDDPSDFPWWPDDKDVVRRAGGIGMVVCSVGADGVPIELGTRAGKVVAARVEVVDDVAELERNGGGRWLTLGTIRVGVGRGLFLDLSRRGYLNGRRASLPLPGGQYLAQWFDAGECLGIRAVHVDHAT